MAEKSGAFMIRVLTTLVILPLMLALVWTPQLRLVFTAFIALLACVGLYEFYALVRHKEISPETIGGIVGGTLVVLSADFYHLATVACVLYAGCLLVSVLHILRGRYSVAGLACSVFGMVYVGWFPAHMVLLRGSSNNGPGLVTLLLVTVVLTDVGAYLTGSTIGRHKMAPRVSPNKTWEGAAGGLVFTILGVMIICGLSSRVEHFPQWGSVEYLLVGVVLSLVAQIGDLAESSMKRSAGVKDSGALFPGHGGVLDRCDGYLFAAPVLYYMVLFVSR